MRRALVVVLTAAATFACGGAPRPESVVRLGAAIPLSGKHAKAGRLFRQGYELAVREWNDAGGVAVGGERRPVELVLYDDKSDAATTVALVERLVTVDGVDALLSGYSTPLVQAQAVVPERHGVPYLNAGGASKAIFRSGGRFVFGLLSPVENLARTTMEWLAVEQDRGRLPVPLRIALAWQNTDHGREYRDGVLGAVRAGGERFLLVLDEPFEHLAKDHTALLVKVKAAEADVFLSDAHEPDFVLQHRAYVELGLAHAVVSYGARGPEASARRALGPHADYLVAAQWWSPALPYPSSRRFVAAFREAYGEEPTEYYPALAFEAVRTLLRAVEAAGRVDRGAIRDALAAIEIDDALVPGGRIAFPAEHRYQIQNPCLLVQNRPGGRVEIVYPPDAATAEAVVPRPAP